MLAPDSMPELNAAHLVRIWNLGPELHPVVERVLVSALPFERKRERARYLRIAAELMGGDRRTLARRLWLRMRELHRMASKWLAIDVATLDGALLAALLVNREVPSRQTVMRAIAGP